jgi:UPF0176 protein
MKSRGFKEVYQIQGGIVRYGERFGDAEDSLWEGSLYVFDKRMNVDFTDKAKTIGQCEKCQAPTSKFYNCANQACRDLILLCSDCSTDAQNLSCSHEHTRGRNLEIAG